MYITKSEKKLYVAPFTTSPTEKAVPALKDGDTPYHIAN